MKCTLREVAFLLVLACMLPACGSTSTSGGDQDLQEEQPVCVPATCEAQCRDQNYDTGECENGECFCQNNPGDLDPDGESGEGEPEGVEDQVEVSADQEDDLPGETDA